MDRALIVNGESGSPVLGIKDNKIYLLGAAIEVSLENPGVLIFERIEEADIRPMPAEVLLGNFHFGDGKGKIISGYVGQKILFSGEWVGLTKIIPSHLSPDFVEARFELGSINVMPPSPGVLEKRARFVVSTEWITISNEVFSELAGMLNRLFTEKFAHPQIQVRGVVGEVVFHEEDAERVVYGVILRDVKEIKVNGEIIFIKP